MRSPRLSQPPTLRTPLASLAAGTRNLPRPWTTLRLAALCALWLLGVGGSRGADAPSAEGLLAHWEFDEGTGSEKVVDRSGNGHDARMEGAAGRYRWGRADDRGFFLQIVAEGATRLTVAPAASLQPERAFTILVHCAADLSSLPQTEGALVWAGETGAPAYALVLRRDGQVVFRGAGLDVAEARFATRLEAGRDTVLCATYDGASLALYLDGAAVGHLPRTGTIASAGKTLYLGGAPEAPFVGNLYAVRIYGRALSPAECTDLSAATAAAGRQPVSAGPPAAAAPATVVAGSDPLAHPDAVFFTAFSSLEPQDAVTLTDTFGKWYHRTGALFMARDNNVLHVRGSDAVPDLSYRPSLQGRYNLYVGMRGVTAPTAIQIKTAGMNQWATVALPEHPADRHVNYDILWAKDVAMDNERLTIHASGRAVYLDYFRFVPTAKDAPATGVDERFVTYGPRHTADDEIQAQISKGVFRERVYRDGRPLPKLSEEAERRGYVLFPTHWMELIFPDSKPAADPGTPALHLAAARGEFEPVAFAVHALRDLEGLSVALDGDVGTLPVSSFDVREVRTLAKRTTNYTGSSEFMDLPCWLEPVTARALAQGDSRNYWITVEVPRDQPPGDYRGTVVVQVAGVPVQRVPLTVTVHPFALDQPGINIGLYYRPLAGLAEPQASFRDMQRHGMTSVAWFGESGLTVSGPPEAPQVRFEGAELTRMLDLFVAAGLSGDFLWCYSGDPLQVYCAKLLPDEAAFSQAYAAIIRQIVAEGVRRRWPRLLFQQYDEVPSNPADFPALLRELRATKLGGGITQQDHLWFKTSRPIQAQIDQCVPYIDIFTLRYSGKPIFYVDTWEQILATARRLERQVYTYNINNGMAIPEMETLRFSAGWFFRSLGSSCTGYYLWAYQFPANDPYRDLDGDTDWILQYPPSADRKGGPALHWEAFREGIDDLRYIATLERLVETYRRDPRAAALATAAGKLLHELAGSLDVARIQRDCVFLESSWDKAETLPDGKRTAEGRFRLPSGWTFEKYDEARLAIAAVVAKIQASVANPP